MRQHHVLSQVYWSALISSRGVSNETTPCFVTGVLVGPYFLTGSQQWDNTMLCHRCTGRALFPHGESAMRHHALSQVYWSALISSRGVSNETTPCFVTGVLVGPYFLTGSQQWDNTMLCHRCTGRPLFPHGESAMRQHHALSQVYWSALISSWGVSNETTPCFVTGVLVGPYFLTGSQQWDNTMLCHRCTGRPLFPHGESAMRQHHALSQVYWSALISSWGVGN